MNLSVPLTNVIKSERKRAREEKGAKTAIKQLTKCQ